MIKISLDADQNISHAIDKAISLLKQGEIVIVPTETSYGLAVDSENNQAVRKLFRIKQRPVGKPLSIFIHSISDIDRYALLSDDVALSRIEHFWPGPVTFVMNSIRSDWPGIVSSECKIGLRCSSHKFVSRLIESYPHPLTATSANLSGQDAGNINDLERCFANYLQLFIVDPVLKFDNLPSTVVDISSAQPIILREGMIDANAIMDVFRDE